MDFAFHQERELTDAVHWRDTSAPPCKLQAVLDHAKNEQYLKIYSSNKYKTVLHAPAMRLLRTQRSSGACKRMALSSDCSDLYWLDQSSRSKSVSIIYLMGARTKVVQYFAASHSDALPCADFNMPKPVLRAACLNTKVSLEAKSLLISVLCINIP